jgi:hypothetical protein
MSKTGTIGTLDLTGAFTKSLVAKLDKAEAERDKLREALQDLYDAMPAGYGDDRALNEALAGAEKALEIAHSRERR